MVTVHRELIARLGLSSPQAIVLATPYAFQENASDVSARTQRYFADSVGLQVRVAAGTSPNADPGMAPPVIPPDEEDEARQAAAIRAADWVFAGPGSPSYALAHWQAGPVTAGLRDRVLAGDGLTVLASAAAATAGRFTLPVYEIYKAGGAPRWLDGLDVLGPLGLTVALIPHYDNAEGGRYDTRHCYLGERRLAVMERGPGAAAAVLGVDAHTDVRIDRRPSEVEIRGRGGVGAKLALHHGQPAFAEVAVPGVVTAAFGVDVVRDERDGEAERAEHVEPVQPAWRAARLVDLVDRQGEPSRRGGCRRGQHSQP